MVPLQQAMSQQPTSRLLMTGFRQYPVAFLLANFKKAKPFLHDEVMLMKRKSQSQRNSLGIPPERYLSRYKQLQNPSEIDHSTQVLVVDFGAFGALAV